MIFQIFALHSCMLKSIQSNNSPGHSHNGQTPMVDLSTDFRPGVLLKRNNKIRRGGNHKAQETGRTPQEEIQVRAVAIAFKVFWLSIEVGTDGIMGNLTIGIVNRTEGITPMRKANRMLPMAVPANKAFTMINLMSFLTKRGIQ